MSHRTHFRPIHTAIAAAAILASTLGIAQMRFSVGVAVPGVSIGINVPSYPDLVPIPGYPVYYAPRLGMNLFFYDGRYWAYTNDNWYSSSWYDGPWYLTEPAMVPDYILRIPIRFYRRPPPYFLHWNREAPPRWGDHWGPQWEDHRRGWDRWDRRFVPPRAPLPRYQRDYPRDRYPNLDHQRAVEERYYHYRPGRDGDHRPKERTPGHVTPPRRAPMERRPEHRYPGGDQRGVPPPPSSRPQVLRPPSRPHAPPMRPSDRTRDPANPAGRQAGRLEPRRPQSGQRQSPPRVSRPDHASADRPPP